MTQPIVMPSEIMDMEDLTAYLRVPSTIPVCKLKIKYKEYPKSAEGFIKRHIKSDPFIEERIEVLGGAVNKSSVIKKKIKKINEEPSNLLIDSENDSQNDIQNNIEMNIKYPEKKAIEKLIMPDL